MQKKAGNSSLVRILGAVVFVLAVVFLTLQQANFLLSRAMLIAFGDSEATYQSAWFELDGDIVAKNVEIYPFNLSEDLVIRFQHVHLETPGWFWFVRNTFDRKLKYAKLDRVHLTLTGGVSDTGMEPSLGDLGPFGFDSAAAFEAEGCAVDGMWAREELEQMGLDVQPPSLEFDYVVAGNKLATKVVLEAKGSARVQLDRKSDLPTAINALLLDQFDETVTSERWELQDLGFAVARNRFCAGKDRVDERVFLQRHVASVARVLEIGGIAVDDATLAAYRRYAQRGGKFTFGGDYTPGIGIEEFYDMRAMGMAWPRMSNASVSGAGADVPVRWESREPWPLPEDVDSTWQALVRERGPEDPIATPSPVANADPAVSVVAADPSAANAPVSSTPAATGPAASVPTASTPVANTPAANAPAASPAAASTTTTNSTVANGPVAETPAAVAPNADAAAAPSTAGPTPEHTLVAAPSAADGTAAAPDPAAPRIERVQATPSASAANLGWQDMRGLLGQRVRLWTRLNPPRLVYVLAADGDSLRVTTRLGGGNAEYTVHRASFLHARVVQ